MSANGRPNSPGAGDSSIRGAWYVNFSMSDSIAFLSPVNTGIAEWYSPVAPGTGLHPRPGNSHDLKAYFPEVDPTWTNLFYPSRKGETIEELHNRIDTLCTVFFDTLPNRLPSEQRKRLVMVTHAAPAIALVRSFVGDRDVNFRAGCCSISEVVRKADVRANSILGAYKAVTFASGAHLKQGSNREWGFDYVEVDKGRVRPSTCAAVFHLG